MRYMVDLYCGFGGASEAMINDHTWDVCRIDNNPLLSSVQGIHIKDVRDLVVHKEFFDDGEIDLIWASPPCTEFSRGYHAPGPTAERSGLEFTPDLELIEAALNIIEKSKPKYWCIENVKGSISHFAKLGLKPRQIIGPFVLYGNFPLLHIDNNFSHNKYNHDSWSTDPLRSNKRAYVPLEISAGMKEAIESQQSIMNWC